MNIFSKIARAFTGTQQAPPSTDSSDRTRVTAQLNHKLMPLDRGERYEDPLNDELAKHGLGEAEGGGTMLSQSKEIDYIDVEMGLIDTERSIPLVIERLEALGAPKGSKLIVLEGNGTREIAFGKREGLAVYLDGTNLPDAVYKTNDVNQVVSEIDRLLHDDGRIEGHWQGPKETALYLYGMDAQLMRTRIAAFLAEHPLCQGARVVPITPHGA